MKIVSLLLILFSLNIMYGRIIYTLNTKKIFVRDCEKDILTLSSADSADDKKEIDFYQGLCYFMKGKMNDKAIIHLKSAYSGSWAPEVSTITQLVLAKIYAEKAEIDSKLPNRKESFCNNRRKAIELFNGIDWKYSDFAYDEEHQDNNVFPKAEIFLNEMTIYFSAEHALSPFFNGRCEIIDGISVSEVPEIVDDKFNELVRTYSGASNPIQAMFSRKNQRIISIKSSGDELLNDYLTKKDALNFKNKSYQKAYDSLKNKLNKYYEDYNHYVVMIKNKIDEVNVFSSGLTTDKDGHNLLNSVNERKSIVTKRINSITQQSNVLSKIDMVIHDLKESDKVNAENNENLKKMCGIYYCHYTSQERELFVRACEYTKFVGTSLCIQKDGKQIFRIDGSVEIFDLAELCIKAGFSKQYAKQNLPSEEYDQCMRTI